MFDMMKLSATAAAISIFALAAPASAAVTLTAIPGTNPYSGPVPTYNFDSGRPAAVTGGSIATGSIGGQNAQPYGSTGGYWSVGPTDGTPGVLSLADFGAVGSISFIWGSVDSYNTLELLGAANQVLYTFNGSNVFNPANGDQGNPATNPLVTLFFSGADQTAVRSLRLSSTQNAFETDNFRINAVPEPSTWALMLLGFGAVGFSMRRGRHAAPRLSTIA
jgi:hypothetical protein